MLKGTAPAGPAPALFAGHGCQSSQQSTQQSRAWAMSKGQGRLGAFPCPPVSSHCVALAAPGLAWQGPHISAPTSGPCLGVCRAVYAEGEGGSLPHRASVLGVCKGTVIPCELDPGTSCTLIRCHGAGGPEALPTTPCSSHLGVGREGTFQKGTLGPPGWSKPGALSFISSTGPPWGQTCPGSSSQGANVGWICPGSSPPLGHGGGLTWTRPEQRPIPVRLTHKSRPQEGQPHLRPTPHQEGGPSSHTHRQGLSQALPAGPPGGLCASPSCLTVHLPSPSAQPSTHSGHFSCQLCMRGWAGKSWVSGNTPTSA